MRLAPVASNLDTITPSDTADSAKGQRLVTAQRFHDFGTASVFDSSQMEPVQFRIAGETFACRPALPGAVLLSFVRNAASNDAGIASAAVMSLLEKAMEQHEYNRFRVLVDRTDQIIPLETLAQIAAWLVEVYTERPTTRSSDSSTGSTATAPTSEAASSSPAAD